MQSFKIAKIMGIPIELHITFILLLIVVYYFWGIEGFILYVSLFTSVILHELGHSYVAKKYGVKIEKILLLPIGGMAMMDEISREGELKIALSGPLVSLVLGTVLLLLSSVKDYVLADYSLFQTVGALNILLGLFNLIPAFPMDGGRVFRALISKLSNLSYVKATKIASTIGQYFSLLLLLFGLINFNVILVLISIFIYFGASQEYRALVANTLFENVSAKDIMSKNIIYVNSNETVDDVLNLMLKHRFLGYPVVEDEKIVGTITINELNSAQKSDKIKDLMEPPVMVPPNAALNQLLRGMGKADRVYVVENDKTLGIISKTDIVRTLSVLGLKNNK
ncbi:CBS domain containing protein [Methanococcus vannielii SB]|uniref:Zinc metalloprotease n=1 Tax=Methanococcus vannielii (strain ATCC 35089 / DSM 1224 / JCM 13029 / OCM 148 / SB) TaxID=406327 RepID=A6US57_METVS|nr:site-2 protease family protein [Methanococcus vannielii]ABR55329.1 CBS domain containing protein [Methanococcus vannielii SB]